MLINSITKKYFRKYTGILEEFMKLSVKVEKYTGILFYLDTHAMVVEDLLFTKIDKCYILKIELGNGL